MLCYGIPIDHVLKSWMSSLALRTKLTSLPDIDAKKENVTCIWSILISVSTLLCEQKFLQSLHMFWSSVCFPVANFSYQHHSSRVYRTACLGRTWSSPALIPVQMGLTWRGSSGPCPAKPMLAVSGLALPNSCSKVSSQKVYLGSKYLKLYIKKLHAHIHIPSCMLVYM